MEDILHLRLILHPIFFDGLGYCSANKYLGVLADIDAVDDSTTVTKDIPLIIDVLGNDKGNLNPATVIIMEEPSHGSVTVNPNGTITYTPQIPVIPE